MKILRIILLLLITIEISGQDTISKFQLGLDYNLLLFKEYNKLFEPIENISEFKANSGFNLFLEYKLIRKNKFYFASGLFVNYQRTKYKNYYSLFYNTYYDYVSSNYIMDEHYSNFKLGLSNSINRNFSIIKNKKTVLNLRLVSSFLDFTTNRNIYSSENSIPLDQVLYSTDNAFRFDEKPSSTMTFRISNSLTVNASQELVNNFYLNFGSSYHFKNLTSIFTKQLSLNIGLMYQF